jgi:hypothetical protein
MRLRRSSPFTSRSTEIIGWLGMMGWQRQRQRQGSSQIVNALRGVCRQIDQLDYDSRSFPFFDDCSLLLYLRRYPRTSCDATRSCDVESASRNLLSCKIGKSDASLSTDFVTQALSRSPSPEFSRLSQQKSTASADASSYVVLEDFHRYKNSSSRLSGRRNCQQLQQISRILFIFITLSVH